MRDPLLWWNDYDELNCEYAVAVEIVRAIQRDAIEAAANAAHWLDKTGGEYARGYNACAFDAGDRIRALLPPAAAEITAEKPEGRA